MCLGASINAKFNLKELFLDIQKIWPRESKTFFKDDSIVPRKKLLDTLSEK
ncbi:hypothetical protein MYAER_2173 [Microcystis aeruginosa NIES-2549]|uniref:Uncharacterized protein n=1 Tax=Microcystis aeruginosa NIES-2549 TaxID=1641812 RepID=A0A0F6U4G7_MICAE|nr:hypothetical protein MYAER_2173 [Microcystis aeruginosa NIES-2549]